MSWRADDPVAQMLVKNLLVLSKKVAELEERGEKRGRDSDELAQRVLQLERAAKKQRAGNDALSYGELEGALEESKEVARKLEGKLDWQLARNASMERDLSSLQTKVARLETELAAARAKHSDAADQLEQTRKELQTSRQAIQALHGDVATRVNGWRSKAIRPLRRMLRNLERAPDLPEGALQILKEMETHLIKHGTQVATEAAAQGE